MKRTTIRIDLKGRRGSSLIGALSLVVFISMLGSSLVAVSSNQGSTSSKDMQATQALYVGHAGMEFAKRQLDMGLSPVATNKRFAYGTYTTSTAPESSRVRVVGEVGPAKKTQSFTTRFSKNCVQLDTSTAYTEGFEIYDVKLIKTCNQRAIVDKLILRWNWDPCVLQSEYSSRNNLQHCPVNDGGAVVKHISLNQSMIYNPGLGYGTPGGGGARSGELIDAVDYVLAANGVYPFQGPPHPIRLSRRIPNHGLYTLTVDFADGSQIASTFQDRGRGQTPPFRRDLGQVIIDPNHRLTLEVLGSAITYGSGGPEIDVIVYQGVAQGQGTSYTTLFGGRDVNGGEVHVTTSLPRQSYVVKANARYLSFFNQTYDSTNVRQVKTLVNGEIAPSLAGFGGQAPVRAFLRDYLDQTGRVRLNQNQVIMLFELGVDAGRYSNHPACDFQDLVVLLTIDPSIRG